MKRVICDDPQRVAKFVSDQMGVENDWSSYKAVGLESDGEIVVGVVYDNYTGTTIFMHIAALPGKKWLTRNFLWFLFYYPFVQLGVKALRGMVPESNAESLRFARGLKGAHLEARLKDAHPSGDMLIYCLRKEDCKYLGIYRNA
ncbi:hypothetical protein [Nitrosovibrio sp. Nv6]|uniref:hypothetical protein n=1 Tax=Nitrosovibrio sp. Nv6 TaxID=1855340 RepID=UPI0008D17B4F|nr:hypothetical protein [Nitrosovibrio sp. Nv6]SEO77538.1 hypothetical protein SAMN05216316_1060 [Nitrosovibrio sp. Nv6]